MDETLSSGQAYMFSLLKMWEEIIELGEQFRVKMLLNQEAVELQREYVAKLSRMWLELLPIVTGRDEFGDIETRFEEFELYYKNPNLLLEPDHSHKLLELEMLLRIILHKARVTYFSEVR